jgi:3-oxoacyl-[acyl-carrier protein] reductase
MCRYWVTANRRWTTGAKPVDIENKIIVITGAARGLGASMALDLAAHGARLALVDLDESALQPVVTAVLEQGSPMAAAYPCDISNEAAVTALFDRVLADFGALHGLVNNAGITRDALTVKYREGAVQSRMSLADWQAVLDVNLTGTFLCGREAATRMIELGSRGCIINLSSISRAGNQGQANYAASKAGVHALAVTWAHEWARYGIRAASVAPGFIATEMVMQMKPEARQRIEAKVPAGRMGTAQEIAHAVRFIFENDYINGRCIEVDGALRF